MPGRQSRQKSRDTLRANRARGVSTSLPTRQARSRSRTEVSLSDSPDGWSVTQLRTKLKDIGIDLPKSTPKSSMLKIFQQFAKQSVLPGQAAETAMDTVVETSPGMEPNVPAHNIAQTDVSRAQDFNSIRNEMTQMQASLAEISRKISDNNTTGSTATATSACTTTMPPTTVVAQSLSGAVRVPIDSLPSVNIVSGNLRKLIHDHKHVNLAMLLIPSMDSDNQTKIIDQEGNQIIVRANDARLQRALTIHEFRTAFSRFKNVICENEPDRRKELDTYADMIDSMFSQFGGTHFYDYHNAFSRKAEQYYISLGICVDWSCRDPALYMQTFAGLKTTTCDLCSSISHAAKFCPLSISNHRFQSTGISSNRQSSPNSFDSNSRTDRYGRSRQFHNGKEICNNFNSPNGCNATHKNFSRISHICSICKAPTHAAFECAKGRLSGSKPQAANQSKQ